MRYTKARRHLGHRRIEVSPVDGHIPCLGRFRHRGLDAAGPERPPAHLGHVLVVQLRLVFPLHLQAEGIHTCRAPSCVVCIDYPACLGPQV